ncbi:MAG: YncE family protein [Treponema sp.]|jgi:YVTN family beta-propeller protein|nr:YncE family protein [Treponema sp.]
MLIYKRSSFLFFSFCLAGILLAAPLQAQTSFKLKSAPPDLNVFFNGELLKPVSTEGTFRNYRIEGTGNVRFTAAGYRSLEYQGEALPIKKGLVEIKLENEKGVLELLSEHSTGIQPKSAYFSPDGKRLFVPLLDQHGVDVFRLIPMSWAKAGCVLTYEKRLTVPGSRAVGFVEIMIDEKRRELWVSNMFQDRVHIYDLDTLDYKTFVPTGGILPKVIVQSPDGKTVVVSNWVSCSVGFIDAETKKLLHTIPFGRDQTPRGMVFTPDGTRLFVTNYDEPVIFVIDMEQNKVITRYRYHTGEGAARHVLYRDEKLYVSDMARGTITILDASTGAVLLSKYVGEKINTIVMSPDGRYIFASSRGTNNPIDYTRPGPDLGAVYMLNTEDLSLKERIWGRNQPTGLAVSPDGKFLVFTDFLDANLEFYRLSP